MDTLLNKILINSDNIDNLYVQEIQHPYFYSDKCWEIRMFPDGILARFDDRKECAEFYSKILHQIYEQNKNIVFVKPPLNLLHVTNKNIL